MNKSHLQITKKVLQIALPLTLIITSTGCGKNKDVTEPTDVKESSVVEIQPTEEELSTDIQIVPDNPVENFQSEDQVVDYFETIDQKLDQLFTKENFNKIKEQTKEVAFSSLVTTVEFFNNNKPIGGYYFSDLTDPAKQKVIEIMERIDKKITEHYPDYKAYMKEKWNIGYDSFNNLFDKGKEKVKEVLGEDTYTNMIETKDKVKEKTKKKVSEWTNGVKDWYQGKKEEYQ